MLVTYRQYDHVILVKQVQPRDIINEESGSHFVVSLSQEESLLFKDNTDFFVQLNVMFSGPDGETRATSVELRGGNNLQHFREVVT